MQRYLRLLLGSPETTKTCFIYDNVGLIKFQGNWSLIKSNLETLLKLTEFCSFQWGVFMIRFVGGFTLSYYWENLVKLWYCTSFYDFHLGWLADLVSRFACNTRVIVDASSNPPVSRLKLLQQRKARIKSSRKQTKT